MERMCWLTDHSVCLAWSPCQRIFYSSSVKTLVQCNRPGLPGLKPLAGYRQLSAGTRQHENITMSQNAMVRNVPLDPKRVAIRFALGSLVGVAGLYLSRAIGYGGLQNLGVLLAVFIGGATAGAALHVGVRGIIGIGLAYVLGGIGCLMSVADTQAMTRREPFFLDEPVFLDILFFVCYFAISWGLGGSLALLFLHTGRWRFFLTGLAGFAGGGVVCAIILFASKFVAELTGNQIRVDRFGLWDAIAVLLAVAVPLAIGGAMLARGLNIIRTLDNSNVDQKMFCLGCRYSLTGLDEHRCPECGRTFDPRDKTTFGPSKKARSVWPAALLAVLAGVPAGLWGALMMGIGFGLGGQSAPPAVMLSAFMSCGAIAASLGALIACAIRARLTPVFGAIFGMAIAGSVWIVLSMASGDFMDFRISIGAMIGSAIIGWVLLRSKMKKR